jgi:very-short-patch-repair endonuclease
MSSGIFVSRLKKLVPYSSSHHEAFLAADEWIKSGHRTNMAPDQWESHRKARSLAGAKHVQGLRRTWQHYNPKNHESYYDGNTEEEKARLAFEHRRSKSPMTVEFWIRKGLDPDEARQWISENASKGGIAVCESLYSKCTSKLEQRVFNELSTKFELMQQLRIKNRFYDIACEKQKKIIEVDGTYWHCDPRLYSADYVHVSGRTAQEVWEHDQRKQSLAEEHGWSVYRVKELDLCKNYKQTLQLLENFLIGD